MDLETKIAVPIVSSEPTLARQVDAARAAGADMVELRVDLIGEPAAAEALLRGPRVMPVILTVRPRAEGGGWTQGEAQRLHLIERLGRLQPGFIDLELSAWRSSREAARIARDLCGESGGNRLIISHHDFESTPTQLGRIFDQLADTPAEIIKAAFTARDSSDTLRVLDQLQRRAPRRKVIALAMGEAGLASRVLARKLGAFLTYAPLSSQSRSAPGQPTLDVLRSRFRWERIQRSTRVFGVVGWPLTHSRGPDIHNAAMESAGVDGVYLPMPLETGYDAFADFMDLAAKHDRLGIAGLSVTLPHKQNAVRWLRAHAEELDPLAERIGAVNTLTLTTAGRWRGDNTDASGAISALSGVIGHADFSGRRAAILGAGGVARAVAFALSQRGCNLTIYNRSMPRGEALAQELRCEAKKWNDRKDQDAEILINCTPVGMWPQSHASPMPPQALRSGQIVFDTVYNPAQTRLLQAAAARGCRVVRGTEMFIAQAAAQFYIWHGMPPDRDIMRAALISDDAG